jgi:hypothetical protein
MVMTLRRIMVLAVLMSCVLLLGWVATFPLAESDMGIAGALAFLLAALIGAHMLAVRHSRDTLNLLSLTGAFYLLSFFFGGVYVWLSLPGGSHTPLDVTVSQAGLMAAIVLVTVAWLCLAAGYLIDPFGLIRAVWRPPSRIARNANSKPVLMSLLGLGWAARIALIAEGNYYHIHTAGSSPSAISWLVHTMSLLPLISLALVSANAYRRDGGIRSSGARSLPVALVLIELAWAIPTGSREAIVTIVLVVVVVRYYVLHRLPSLKVVILTTAIFVLIIFPVVAAYRSSDFRASPTKALSTAVEQQLHSTNTQAADAGEATLARFADVTALARIHELGRSRMSFSTEDTLRYSLEGLVPRAFFPQKANSSAFGNEFGRAYGYLAPSNFSTAIAATQPGELYLGGGWTALLLGMAVLGGLLRMMDEYLGARRTDPGILALYALAVPIVLVGLETSIAIGFVGAIKAVVVVAVIIVAVSWPFSRHDMRSGVPARMRGAL